MRTGTRATHLLTGSPAATLELERGDEPGVRAAVSPVPGKRAAQSTEHSERGVWHGLWIDGDLRLERGGHEHVKRDDKAAFSSGPHVLIVSGENGGGLRAGLALPCAAWCAGSMWAHWRSRDGQLGCSCERTKKSRR